MTDAPRVEILLLNWNGWRDTIECLDSLLALDYPNFGLVVCDNASPDGSVDRIETWARGELDIEPSFSGRISRIRPGRTRPLRTITIDREAAESGVPDTDDHDLVIIETGGNLGFSAGNNVGLRYLQARSAVDYVWILNNDTVVHPDSLKHLVACAASDPAIGVVGATVLEFSEPEVVQYLGGASFAPWKGRVAMRGHGQPATSPRNVPAPLDYVSGGCMLVPMRVFDDVGLLDERFFMYSEDADWCFSVRQAGYRLSFAPAAEIWHKGGASSIPGSPLHDYHNMVGNLLMMQKHHPSHMWFTVPYALYRYLAPKIVRRQWGRAAAIARAFRDVALGMTGAEASHRPAAAVRPRVARESLLSADAP